MKAMDISSLVFADLMANLFGIFLVLSALLIGMVRIEAAMLIDPPETGPQKPLAITPGPNTPTLEISSGQQFIFRIADKLTSKAASLTEVEKLLAGMHPAALVLKVDYDVSTGVTRHVMVLCQEMGIRMFWGSDPKVARQ